MRDYCKTCIYNGNICACRNVKCNLKSSWFVREEIEYIQEERAAAQYDLDEAERRMCDMEATREEEIKESYKSGYKRAYSKFSNDEPKEYEMIFDFEHDKE